MQVAYATTPDKTFKGKVIIRLTGHDEYEALADFVKRGVKRERE
jgi:hypothetical protein